MAVRQRWERRHADGSRSIITEHADRTFIAEDVASGHELPDRGPGRVACHSMGESHTYVESAVRDRGHVCGDGCGEWFATRASDAS